MGWRAVRSSTVDTVRYHRCAGRPSRRARGYGLAEFAHGTTPPPTGNVLDVMESLLVAAHAGTEVVVAGNCARPEPVDKDQGCR
jgi:hypothetical protein